MKPQERAELYAWIDRHRSSVPKDPPASAFEQGLGSFGTADEAALMDEVVDLANEERRRPSAAV